MIHRSKKVSFLIDTGSREWGA